MRDPFCPHLIIDLAKIRDNTSTLSTIAHPIEIFGVTKGCAGAVPVARAMIDGGATGLADSRLPHLRELRECFPRLPLLALRQPMRHELSDMVGLDLTIMVSDPSILASLAEICRHRSKQQEILVMIEVGDERDGLAPENFLSFATQLERWPTLRLSGIAANVGCHGSQTNCDEAVKIITELAKKNMSSVPNLTTISAGNSSCWGMLSVGKIPGAVNHLRLGELILLGRETVNGESVDRLNQDACRVQAEVLEAATKKSGKQLVLGIGCQDIGLGEIKPLDKRLEVARITSDHTVLRVGGDIDLKRGDQVSFAPSYFALQALSGSAYVRKTFISYNKKEMHLISHDRKF